MAPRPTTTVRRRFDSRQLGRVTLWGLATAAALLSVVMLGRSERGRERLALATAMLRGDAPVPQTPVADNNGKLVEDLRVLAADRDRLAARIENLERNLGEVTGSIERRLTAAATPPSTAATPPSTATPSPTAAAPSSPTVTSRTPSPSSAVPAEPARSVFGLDLGGAANLAGLRALWAATTAKHGSLLQGLQPLIAIREQPGPAPTELRLVVGPLPSAGAALRLCSLIAASGVTCQVAAFEGQKLALR